jgi:hypothetical protein
MALTMPARLKRPLVRAESYPSHHKRSFTFANALMFFSRPLPPPALLEWFSSRPFPHNSFVPENVQKHSPFTPMELFLSIIGIRHYM